MKKFVFGALLILAISVIFSVCASAAESVAVVTVSELNLREEPTVNSDIVGTLEENTTVTILEEHYGFSLIDYNGTEAFAYSEHLSEDWLDSFIDFIEEENKPEAEKVLDFAKNFIGVPYVYGGSTPRGFDCSGFVKYVLAEFGIDAPRVSYEQMSMGKAVSISDIKPGDLLFFRRGGHVGFYVGDGMYIHAPQSGRTVSIDPLTRDICAARRIFND